MEKKLKFYSDTSVSQENHGDVKHDKLLGSVDETDVGSSECSSSEAEWEKVSKGKKNEQSRTYRSRQKKFLQSRSLRSKNQLLKWTLEWKLKKKKKKKPQVVFSVNDPLTNYGYNERNLQPSLNTAGNRNDCLDVDPDWLESDDDEGEVNRIGNVPLWWYDHLDHIGYDSTGAHIKKSLEISEVSSLLRNANNSEAWREVQDIRNQRTINLSDEDLQIIFNMRAGKYPLASFDPYGPDSTVLFDNPEAAIHPVATSHPPKRRFLPSMWEAKRIHHLMRCIREGRLRTLEPKMQQVYDIWGESIVVDASDSSRGFARGPPSLPAPKISPPSHAESYNPSEEYLFTEEEKEEWKALHPEDRELNFIPRKYPCLRRVPAYEALLLERFQRCLDLYLCPRSIRTRMNIDPESLLPQLPPAQNFRPFPVRLGLTFESSDTTAGVSLGFDSTGTYLAVARTSGCLEIYDTSTTQLVLRWKPQQVNCSEKETLNMLAEKVVAFSPTHPLLLLAHDSFVYILLLPLPAMMNSKGECLGADENDTALSHWNLKSAEELLQLNSTEKMDNWESFYADEGIRGWKIIHPSVVTSVAWHRHGVYFLSVCETASSPSQRLFIHSLTKRKSISPLRNSGMGRVTKAAFHPTKPFLFTAYQNGIRLYNLQGPSSIAEEKVPFHGNLIKKFKGVKDVLDIAIHPTGDHLVTGSVNRRVSWFDEDLGMHPYKILRYHKGPVRTVDFHKLYPLLCSGSLDGSIHIFYAKIYEDLMNPPALIPVKKLIPFKELGEENTQVSSVLHCQWHPFQPWLATVLRNGKIGIFV